MKINIAAFAMALAVSGHASAALNVIPGQLLLCREDTFNVETGEIIDTRESLIVDNGNRFTAISGGSGAVLDSGPLIPNKWDKDLIQPPRGYPDPNYVPGSEATIVKHGGELLGVYSYSRFPAAYVEWDCRK